MLPNTDTLNVRRIFPEVPDVENPAFFMAMDRLVVLSDELLMIGRQDLPKPLKGLMQLPKQFQMGVIMLGLFFAKPLSVGTYDAEELDKSQLVY